MDIFGRETLVFLHVVLVSQVVLVVVFHHLSDLRYVAVVHAQAQFRPLYYIFTIFIILFYLTREILVTTPYTATY